MMKDALIPEINWTHSETTQTEIVGVANVTQELRKRLDGSQLTFTLVEDVTTSAFFYDFSFDSRFTQFGIETEPNGLLINQEETRKLWAKKTFNAENQVTVGIKPQDYLLGQDDPVMTREGSVGFPATNTFWQKGGFFIHNRELIHLPDDDTLNGNLEALVLTENGWQEEDINIENGQPNTNLRDVRLGLSMPMVLKRGVLIPQTEIVARGDLRAVADLRNFLNFADGRETLEGFDHAFFDIMRLIQPGTPGGAEIVARSKDLIADSKEVGMIVSLPTSKAEKFATMIERFDLTDHFEVIETGSKESLVKVTGPFPNNRTPITVIGHTASGKLLAGFFNGRQSESTGATFDEAGSILKEYGAISAGIGACGGDTAVLHKVHNQTFETLNKPSNKNGSTRPAPNFLTIQGTDPLLRYT